MNSHLRGLVTPAEALYQVFTASRPILRSHTTLGRICPPCTLISQRRNYIKASHVQGIHELKKITTVDPFSDVTKNGDIKSKQVYVVHPQNNTVTGPVDRNLVLRSLKDQRRLEREGLGIFKVNEDEDIGNDELLLVQVGQRPDNNLPVCKIMQRKILVLQRLERKRLEKEKAKQKRASVPKEIELNWAVTENDLASKLRQMETFLSKGKRVDIILANKRKSRKVATEEAERVLELIREKIQELGAKEALPMEGKILGRATLHVEKKA